MADITTHEGRKYLRKITPVIPPLWKITPDPTDPVGTAPKVDLEAVEVDVYAVLIAYNVTCPAVQHALKKLLAAGGRGKGSTLQDLVGARAAVDRAIELEKDREKERNAVEVAKTEEVAEPFPIRPALKDHGTVESQTRKRAMALIGRDESPVEKEVRNDVLQVLLDAKEVQDRQQEYAKRVADAVRNTGRSPWETQPPQAAQVTRERQSQTVPLFDTDRRNEKAETDRAKREEKARTGHPTQVTPTLQTPEATRAADDRLAEYRRRVAKEDAVASAVASLYSIPPPIIVDRRVPNLNWLTARGPFAGPWLYTDVLTSGEVRHVTHGRPLSAAPAGRRSDAG